MASDFHTHCPAPPIPALISVKELLPDRFTSLEIHPWDLPHSFDKNHLPSPDILNSFAALGEIGLDKLRGPELPIQYQYCSRLLEIAADCRKPVVIHCVKAFQELFELLRPFKLRVMVHGFRSSPELLDELWKRGITVSFHPAAKDNAGLMNKLADAAGAYGFESDDKSIAVTEILHYLIRQYKLNDIEKITDQHFTDFLGI